MTPRPFRVGLLAYAGCFASELFTVVDTLTVANHIATLRREPARFVTSVHAASSDPVPAGGVSIGARRMTYALDLLVVPGFDLDPAQEPMDYLAGWQPEVELIRRAATRSLPVAGICVGTFLLADAGILDGRRATTAWLVAERLARAYPGVAVDHQALLVEDGPVTTTGAFSAAADLALHLVRLHVGEATMRATARITLSSGRSSQAPYIDELLLGPAGGGPFSAAVRRHLGEHLDDDYDLGALAAAHHVSTRTLLRRFRAETGQTPLDYLQALRVSRARQVLESTSLSVDQVAHSVGYQDVSTFRRLFSRTVGLSPSQYRRTFRHAVA
jgi:transcriptional regulator GlxA family with amidase domain